MSNGCPCYVLNEPCIPQCTCVNGFMSGGCRRCARYGSLAQRRSAARRLAAAQAEIARLTAERDNLAILVRRLTASKHLADCSVKSQAIGYLQRHDLIGSPLRDANKENENAK